MSSEAMFLKVQDQCKHPGLSGLTPVSSTVTGLSPGVGAVLQKIIVFIISSVRSSSGYHGLLEGSHFFRFFKFFRFESESESERTQHVLYF